MITIINVKYIVNGIAQRWDSIDCGIDNLKDSVVKLEFESESKNNNENENENENENDSLSEIESHSYHSVIDSASVERKQKEILDFLDETQIYATQQMNDMFDTCKKEVTNVMIKKGKSITNENVASVKIKCSKVKTLFGKVADGCKCVFITTIKIM